MQQQFGVNYPCGCERIITRRVDRSTGMHQGAFCDQQITTWCLTPDGRLVHLCTRCAIVLDRLAVVTIGGATESDALLQSFFEWRRALYQPGGEKIAGRVAMQCSSAAAA